MARVASTTLVRSPDGALEVRNGGGCLILFGLPFAAVGILGFGNALSQLLRRLPDVDLEKLLLLPFMLIFAVVGLAVILGRWGVRLDRGAGRAVSWWSVGPLGKSTEVPLSSFRRVRMAEDTSGDSISYEASLDGPGVKAFTIANLGDENEVRRIAERVADELQLPLADRTHGAEVVREPGRMDEPLVERLRRTGALPAPPSPPPDLRSHVLPEAAGVRIEMPPPGLVGPRAFSLGCSVIMLGIFAAFAWPFARILLRQTWGEAVIAGIIALVVLPPLLSLIPGLGRRTIVTASPAALVVETRAPFSRTRVEIQASELEELLAPTALEVLEDGTEGGANLARTLRDGADATGNPAPRWLKAATSFARFKGMTAVSDRTSVTFGQGLPQAEQAYLAARIINAIAGR